MDHVNDKNMGNDDVHTVSCNPQDLAMSLNVSGILYLRAGKSYEAMEVFRDALTYVKDQFLGPAEESEEETMHVGFDDAPMHIQGPLDTSNHISISNVTDDLELEDYVGCLYTSKLNIQSVPISCSNAMKKSSHLCCTTSTDDDSFIAMYDRALHVVGLLGNDNDANLPLTVFDQEFLGSIVTYNMALASHRLGVKKGMTSSLLKALHLYKISYHIIHEYVEDECNREQHNAAEDHGRYFSSNLQSNGNVALLLMAIFNNMAHISSLLYRTDDMRNCIETLQSILCDASQTYDVNNQSLDSEEFVVFFMNAMITQETVLSLAPAA